MHVTLNSDRFYYSNQTNRWTVSGFQDSHSMKPLTLIHVECFIHCLFLHTANDPKFKHLPFVAISWLRISDEKLMDPFLVIFLSVFWLQLRNLLLLCEPREFMHLMKLFFKNSADEVENAPKSLNSQGFHTTFIFGNFTDDIGNMRTLKTPTSPGTLIWALMVHWITRPHSRGNENASRLPPLLLHSVVITHTHSTH